MQANLRIPASGDIARPDCVADPVDELVGSRLRPIYFGHEHRTSGIYNSNSFARSPGDCNHRQRASWGSCSRSAQAYVHRVHPPELLSAPGFALDVDRSEVELIFTADSLPERPRFGDPYPKRDKLDVSAALRRRPVFNSCDDLITKAQA